MRELEDDRYGCIEVSQCSGDLALFGHLDECSRYVQLTIRKASWGPAHDGIPAIQQHTPDIRIQVAMSTQDFLQMISNVFSRNSRLVPCTIQRLCNYRYDPLKPMTKTELAQQISAWHISERGKQLHKEIEAVQEWVATHKLPKNVQEQFRKLMSIRTKEVDEIIAYAKEIFMETCKEEENDRD